MGNMIVKISDKSIKGARITLKLRGIIRLLLKLRGKMKLKGLGNK